ncbi:hypothetical protein PXNS11_530007 [Stutzerimonas xanthomarina]|nr:hypothetical protein PXNS11_530007 [Stutzerimonas xanthomarina]
MLGNGRAAWFGVSIGGKKEGPRIYHDRPLLEAAGPSCRQRKTAPGGGFFALPSRTA